MHKKFGKKLFGKIAKAEKEHDKEAANDLKTLMHAQFKKKMAGGKTKKEKK